MQQMQLWAPGEVYRQLDGIEPVLESWNKKTDPGKQKLDRYLEKLEKDLGPLPADERDLGRIVSLGLHLTRDDKAWLGIPIGMHWRLVPK